MNAFDPERLEEWRKNALWNESAERLKSYSNPNHYDCSCGKGRLSPKTYNDGEFMGGYVASQKCLKCGKLHYSE